MNYEFSTHREERIINGTGEQWDREAHLEQHKDKEKLVLSSQVERLGRLSGLKFQDKAHKKNYQEHDIITLRSIFFPVSFEGQWHFKWILSRQRKGEGIFIVYC